MNNRILIGQEQSDTNSRDSTKDIHLFSVKKFDGNKSLYFVNNASCRGLEGYAVRIANFQDKIHDYQALLQEIKKKYDALRYTEDVIDESSYVQ